VGRAQSIMGAGPWQLYIIIRKLKLHPWANKGQIMIMLMMKVIINVPIQLRMLVIN
jgi:hypothetical protein